MYKILHFKKSLKMQQDRQPHKTIIAISEIGDYKGRTEKKHLRRKATRTKVKLILYKTNHFLLMGSGLEPYFFCTDRENA